MTTQTIFRKLENLEREIQRLKLESFFALPRKQRRSLYSEKTVQKAVRETRKDIWEKRYAKKV